MVLAFSNILNSPRNRTLGVFISQLKGKNMGYNEKRIEMPLGFIPPQELVCPDCGRMLVYPDYRCEHCKHEITFYLTQYATRDI